MRSMRQSLYSRKRVRSQFQKSILSLNPISYYPLDDTGNIAYDEMNRQNLIYPSVNVLRQPSLLASGEGSSVLFNLSTTQLIGNYNFNNSRFTIGGITRINGNLQNRLFGVGLSINTQRAEIECLIGSSSFSGAGRLIIGHSSSVSFYNSSSLLELVIGRSYFICMTLEGNILKIYLNGLLVVQVNTSGNINLPTTRQNTFYFGLEGSVLLSNLNLSNVFVCDYAITQAQVNNIIGLI
jgi:hypothetical protein